MSVMLRATLIFLTILVLPCSLAAAGSRNATHRNTVTPKTRTDNFVTADASVAYGRHLASECVACHRPHGLEDAIPVIAGKPADEIIEALAAYRDGRKTNPVMVSVARSLDADETAAVAAYLASLPKPAAATTEHVRH